MFFQEPFAAPFRSTFSNADNSHAEATDVCGDLPQVPSDLGDELTKPIAVEELEKVLKKMKLGLAPGSDGIPTDFYRKFSSVLGSILVALVNAFLETGECPASFK